MLRRIAAPVQKSATYSRKMAHAKEAPKGGLEGFVATYLPKNHHVRDFSNLFSYRINLLTKFAIFETRYRWL